MSANRPAAPGRPARRFDRKPRDAGPERAGLAARRTATKLLAAVVDARTPLDGLTDNEHGHPHYLALEPRDRALVRAILGAALRRRGSLEAAISKRLKSPLPPNASTVSHILHVGAAQILLLDVPDSAAVDLAVDMAKADPRAARFAALVNAVLRGIARDRAAGLTEADDVPAWYRDMLLEAWGAGRTRDILAAQRLEAPTDFTVRGDPRRWADAFGGIVLPTGSVRVARSGSIPELPGFADGHWWVQDAAAALPARLLGDVDGLQVADLCAAPGGKTAQLVLAGGRVTAVDISANRLRRLRQNLERLRLPVEVAEVDILDWQPAERFDAVLLDAPCSSTGTVRRHPDIPWTKTPADIDRLADLQRRLLDRAVTFARQGGRIVFSNCSLDPREGENLVAAFLRETPAVVADPILADELPGLTGCVTGEGWLRTTPADMDLGDPAISGMDGFFAARFRRR